MILDDRCRKVKSMDDMEEILKEGDCFRYADTELEILKIEEVDS